MKTFKFGREEPSRTIRIIDEFDKINGFANICSDIQNHIKIQIIRNYLIYTVVLIFERTFKTINLKNSKKFKLNRYKSIKLYICI